MPIMYQKWIVRQDLRDHPHRYYVFGDNAQQRGLRGQAKEMRGEPNALGIPTKWYPSMRPDAFFRDDQMSEILELITPTGRKIKRLLKMGQTIVWPSDGIGTGLSRLSDTAPQLAEMLETLPEFLAKLHGRVEDTPNQTKPQPFDRERIEYLREQGKSI